MANKETDHAFLLLHTHPVFFVFQIEIRLICVLWFWNMKQLFKQIVTDVGGKYIKHVTLYWSYDF
ncbi:hypothetical protein J2T15_004682 [Paenibacillus harenae]|uniref:Uncharacterized protein n=1 Tax=Paenibacillus harenae TaxID=306543 RepID=A0ABT9UAK0_PAEHA|nr:hypothetical protein [Paenibacillus harenae]